MALDPRIALMGRSVEVPDAVVRRGQRAHARLIEDQDEALRRQAEDEAQIDQVMRQTGGDLSPGTIARTFGINWKAGQALSKLANDRLKVDAEVATQTATQAYRGAQTANQQQQTKFAAEVQPNKVATEAANASIAGQKAGTIPAAGDLASQFAQRAAQNTRNQAQQEQAEAQTATIIPFDDFAAAFKQANPNATPVEVQFAYSRRNQAPPKQVPGVDVPFSSAVAAQKQQIAAAGRVPRGGGSGVEPGMLEAVKANPSLYFDLTPTVRGKLLGPLNAAGVVIGKPLSEKAATTQADMISGIDSIRSTIEGIRQGEQNIGPFAGWLTQSNPWASEGGKRLESQIALTRQIVGKALEGGVLRKEDEVKYEAILGSIRNTPGSAIEKLGNVERELNQKLDTWERSQRATGRRVERPESATAKKPTLRYNEATGRMDKI